MELVINDRIKKRTITNFNRFTLELAYDSVASAFSVEFYFDPKNHDHAELACVSHMHEAIVSHEGETLITGYIITQAFNKGPKKELAQLAGYSKAGIFEDCDIPTSMYPLEIDGMTLKDIVSKIIAPFNIGFVIDASASKASTAPFLIGDPVIEDGYIQDGATTETSVENDSLADKMNKNIKKANATESKNIKSFFTDLCAQRNIVLSHNSDGNLLFTTPKTHQKPVANFGSGTPSTHISLSFNGQMMHSHITVVKQADSDGGNAEEVTIRNPYVPILYRPKVITQTAGDDTSLEQTAQQALAAELKGVQVIITTDRWKIDGKMIRPNTLVTAYSPENFLYKKVLLFVEKVKYDGDKNKYVATLTCTLPEVYNTDYPQNQFVDVHKNFPRI
ncbi:MAG TPA: hypothetical protein VN922_19625 [Bacteroidia bacterium]|nr:hypothetical protein [Bacteroidia bacterium]